jgi:hypothetical protein
LVVLKSSGQVSYRRGGIPRGNPMNKLIACEYSYIDLKTTNLHAAALAC